MTLRTYQLFQLLDHKNEIQLNLFTFRKWHISREKDTTGGYIAGLERKYLISLT